MEIAELLNLASIIEEKDADNYRAGLVAAAFSVWLANNTKMSFERYLKKYGLIKKEDTLTVVEKKKLADEAKANALRVLRMDKKAKKK